MVSARPVAAICAPPQLGKGEVGQRVGVAESGPACTRSDPVVGEWESACPSENGRRGGVRGVESDYGGGGGWEFWRGAVGVGSGAEASAWEWGVGGSGRGRSGVGRKPYVAGFGRWRDVSWSWKAEKFSGPTRRCGGRSSRHISRMATTRFFPLCPDAGGRKADVMARPPPGESARPSAPLLVDFDPIGGDGARRKSSRGLAGGGRGLSFRVRLAATGPRRPLWLKKADQTSRAEPCE